MRVCPRCRSIYSMPVDRCGLDGTGLVEQEADPLIGGLLDRYRIVESLGRGAMGCVYRGAHTVLVNECAIKVLYGNFALNQRLVERFRREAQAIGQMSHPNIVNVIDFGRTNDGLTFLVMELINGRTLERAIETDGPFVPARAASIARQIAAGLGEAHRHGFVHRDMKPANVMLAKADGHETVKLLDFGVVGLIQAATMAKLTVAGHIVGTPNYMAPEQARSSSVSPAADLYALGVILYEMLSGRPPFEGYGVAEVLLKHLNDPPPPLSSETHEGLARLTTWLLAKRPDQRPPSAQRVIAEIDRLGLSHRPAPIDPAEDDTSRRPALPALPALDEETPEDGRAPAALDEETPEVARPPLVLDDDTPQVGVEAARSLGSTRRDPRAKGGAPQAPLVAPMLHARAAARVAELPRGALEGATEVDFRRDRVDRVDRVDPLNRPPIRAVSNAELFSSTSIADTAPPNERAAGSPSGPGRDRLLENRTVRDTPVASLGSDRAATPVAPPIAPARIDEPVASVRRPTKVGIGVAIGCALFVFVLLLRYFALQR